MPDPRAKLGPEATRLAASGGRPGPVRVLLRTRAEPDDGERARLAEAGLRVETVAGDVLTGEARPADLPAIAALDLVLYLDASRPLYPEQAGPDEAPEPDPGAPC